jgi:hypothetical protein
MDECEPAFQCLRTVSALCRFLDLCTDKGRFRHHVAIVNALGKTGNQIGLPPADLKSNWSATGGSKEACGIL